MSLRMVIGRSGTNHSEFILDEIANTLHESPVGRYIYYIVPEQMTFQEEYNLLKKQDISGSIRAQVVSFSRLAYRVLQETGGSTKQFIGSTGTQMMLRKIIEERTEQFLMFQKAVDKQGFIQELEGIITEFKRHNISPEILYEQITYTKQNVALTNKLLDIHYIYARLAQLLEDKYIDGEDQLQLLVEKITATEQLQEAEIYINGFFRFTPKELEIIRELLKVSKRVTISFIADEQALEQSSDELDLFYQTTETYHVLKQLAAEEEITVEKPVLMHVETGVFHDKPYFYHLEQHFDERPLPVLTTDDKSPVILREAVHPRAEVEGMVQEILRLVREDQYRYRDMVVFVRDPDSYHDLIQTMFHSYHIPFFIDEKRTMLNHPLIEFIRSLFDLVESNWRYDALFRLLKTGFIRPTDEEYPLTMDAIDTLENYCLEYGIRSRSQWLQDEAWVYKRGRGFEFASQTDQDKAYEKGINAYRMQVVQAIEQFDRAVRQEKTVRDKCVAIYQLLDKLSIPTQLETARFNFDEAGQIEKGREEEQVWNGVMQLLDEFVEMVGDDVITFTSFQQILEAGLEALEFSHVPPTMDHVIVASIDQSRIETKKAAFLLGVNEGTWPLKPALDGMINEREREFLKQFGMELAESSRRVLLDDNFYMYVAFTKATEYLSVSYVLSDSDGNTKIPSPLIQRLQTFFPHIETELLMEVDELQDANRFITTKEMTRAPLTVQLARYLRGYEMDDIWWDVLNWYTKNDKKHGTTYRVLQSVFYENKPVSLTKDTVGRLYPKQVRTSVSRLEMLHRCSYQHFLQYSLNLKERRTYSLDAPDIGSLFHEALKTITEWVQREGKSFAQLTKEESATYAQQSMEHLAPLLQHHILSSSNRYRYIQRKLRDVIAQATFILSEQARASGFSPIGIELGFGEGQPLKPLSIPLREGFELLLRGRIDRVDEAKLNDQLYLRIIDYKSSARGLQLVDVYYGLALQMITYLHVILMQAEEWLGMKASPAGILYFHVHDAIVSAEGELSDDEIETEIFKQYKMDGLVAENETITKIMDDETDNGWSPIIPIGYRKDGEFRAGSKTADEATFALLQEHIRSLIQAAGLQMISGEIKLNPYEFKNQKACTYCPFKSVCQFDPILKENNYRTLRALNNKEALHAIEERSDQ